MLPSLRDKRRIASPPLRRRSALPLRARATHAVATDSGSRTQTPPETVRDREFVAGLPATHSQPALSASKRPPVSPLATRSKCPGEAFVLAAVAPPLGNLSITRGASAIPFPRDCDRRLNLPPMTIGSPRFGPVIALIGNSLLTPPNSGSGGTNTGWTFRAEATNPPGSKELSAMPRPIAPVIPNSPTSVSPCCDRSWLCRH